MAFDTIPSDDVIQKTIAALAANGIEAVVVDNASAAKAKLFELMPEGSEVMNNTSTTLIQIGAVDDILKSGKYKPVRDRFADPAITELEKQQWGAAPPYAIGSVHAITEDGHIMIASATGSQLPGYANGALNVIWVAGAHKIVKDVDEGFKRINEYTLPLENVRSMKAYGAPSGVNKLLIINKEVKPNRIKLILVKEVLGF